MRSGKCAFCLLPALIALSGCTSTSAPRAAAPARPRPVAAAPAPVRATEPPVNPVQLASAQEPKLPPLPPPASSPSVPPLPPPVPTPSAPPSPTPSPAPTPPAPLPPSPSLETSPPRPIPENRLRLLHAQAAREFAAIDSYTCRLIRREQVNGKVRSPEVIRLQSRKQPWSVRLVWLDGEGKGREVIYVKGQYDNKLNTLLAAGDVPLMPAGKRMALAPDSLLVRAASRHSVTEAGIGNMIDRFGRLVELHEKSEPPAGTLRYLGPQRREGFEQPLETVEQIVPAGAEKELPRGGKRWWHFDPATRGLPVLIVTQDDQGQEVEYYQHDRFFFHRLGEDEFNPDKQWGKR